MANSRYRNAIASIESAGHGDYIAVGPRHPKLGRALGRYQIMESNVEPWGLEAIGRPVSVSEFMANPKIQDAIFDAKFGSYVDRYGERGASQAWFAGPGGVGKNSRSDVLGTTVGSYGDRFIKALESSGNENVLGGEHGDILATDLLSMFEAPAPVPDVDEAVDALSDQSQAQAQTAADMLKLFDLSPAPLQGTAPALERIAQPPSATQVSGEIIPQGGGDFFDIAAGAVRPFTETLGAVGGSLFGDEPSPSAQALPESIPIYSTDGASIPLSEGFREAVGPVLDVGLGAASGLGALYAGGIGAAADVAEGLGMSKGGAKRLARDLTAIPEAFAGTPGIVAPASGARFGFPSVADDVPAATVARQAARGAGRVAGEAQSAGEGQEKMRRLIAKAAGNNPAARQELAEMARVNPEAAAAAKRLGMDIPADVFADNAMVQQASGMVRAVRGSDAASEWADTFNDAQTRAAEIMRQEGATLDLSTQSENVRSALRNGIDTLRNDGGKLFEEVKASIPSGARVQPTESVKAVNEIVTGLGGVEALTGVERRLFKALTSGEGMTYERLMREKDQLARAAFKSQGPYADADTRTATRLYNAISQDQRNFVEVTGDASALTTLDRANSLWSQAKSLEDDLVAGFGKDGEGSIASKLTSALTQGSKGDIRNLNRVLGVIPEGLRKEALLTGIDTLVQARSGQGGFSFPQYAKLYRGIRQNSEVFSQISKELGPETTAMMRDLYEVSVRMDRAAQNVPRTGLANQSLIGESLLARIMDSSAGGAAKTGIGGLVGGAAGGPLGAGVGAAAAGSIKMGGKRAAAVGQLFRSDEFQRLAVEAARSGTASPANVSAVVKSPAYRKWARTAQIENPEQWLLNALTAQAAAQTVETQNVR